MTTGVTTGPFTLVPGTPLTLNDPALFTTNSTSAQLQNLSGFSLSVLSAGNAYTIPPYTATTIPSTGTGAPIIVTVGTGLANQVGTLTAVWMIDGEAPPIPDGSLFTNTANSRLALAKSNAVLPVDNKTVLLQATDQSMYLIFICPGAATNVTYTVQGNNSLAVYATGTVYLNDNVLQVGPFPVFGSVDTSVNINMGENPAAIPYTLTVVAMDSLATPTPQQVVNPFIGTKPVPLYSTDIIGTHFLKVTKNVHGTFPLLPGPPAGYANRFYAVGLWGGATGTVTINNTATGDLILQYGVPAVEVGVPFALGLSCQFGLSFTWTAGPDITVGLWYDLVPISTMA